MISSSRNNPTCETCRFFNRFNHGDGECRRHAPVTAAKAESTSVTGFAIYPRTYDYGWCGDHEPVKDEK